MHIFVSYEKRYILYHKGAIIGDNIIFGLKFPMKITRSFSIIFYFFYIDKDCNLKFHNLSFFNSLSFKAIIFLGSANSIHTMHCMDFKF
jgi:hypothetical protein